MKNILCHLPCLSAEEQLKFYTSIGFDIIEINKYSKKPNKDIMVKYKKIFLQFYINENLRINENISIKYISVDNAEQLYETFINNLKRNGLEIPRDGIPGITEIEGLEGKKQFSIADPSGNTFIIKTEDNYEEEKI